MPDISVLVEGGKATAGAPLGPALGPTGVNIGEVVAQINAKTANFSGMKLPVKIIVDPTKKSFEIEVGMPPTSALIKKEIKLEKGAANPKTENKGNMTLAQVRKVAEMKMEELNSLEFFSAVREVVGTANSMGVFIEGKHAKEFQKDLESGKYDSDFGRESVAKGVKKEVESIAKDLGKATKEVFGQKDQLKEEFKKATADVAKNISGK